MEFTQQQTAIILAALRHCRNIGISHPENLEKLAPLSVTEIDELASLISSQPEPERGYTVVGRYPDRMWDGEMRDATFVEAVEAATPNEAAQIARLMMAKNMAGSFGETDEKAHAEMLAESANDIATLAVFAGNHADLFDPSDRQA